MEYTEFVSAWQFHDGLAFLALLFLIKIPEVAEDKKENVLVLAKEGIAYLKNTPMILTMILFLSGINLVASAFDVVFYDSYWAFSWRLDGG